jgi:hypothetical protein
MATAKTWHQPFKLPALNIDPPYTGTKSAMSSARRVND